MAHRSLAFIISVLDSAYTCVPSSFLCPRNFWICPKGMPPSMRAVDVLIQHTLLGMGEAGDHPLPGLRSCQRQFPPHLLGHVAGLIIGKVGLAPELTGGGDSGVEAGL
jgi:hypothetical protein